jgi:hypothetical protein
MNSPHQSNLKRFISLTKQLYINDGSIDILINPDLYSERYGMACRFLKNDYHYIKDTLEQEKIKIIECKDGLFRVVDNRTYKIKKAFKCVSISLLSILIIILIVLQFHILDIFI